MLAIPVLRKQRQEDVGEFKANQANQGYTTRPCPERAEGKKGSWKEWKEGGRERGKEEEEMKGRWPNLEGHYFGSMSLSFQLSMNSCSSWASSSWDVMSSSSSSPLKFPHTPQTWEGREEEVFRAKRVERFFFFPFSFFGAGDETQGFRQVFYHWATDLIAFSLF